MTVEFRQIEIADTDAFRAAVDIVAQCICARGAILVDGTYHDEIIMARLKG